MGRPKAALKRVPAEDSTEANSATPRSGALSRAWRLLGPGVVTGAADDDPSSVATYSVAGAQYGLAFLWTTLVTWPLMAFVQMMCARIGMVTGRGLSATLRLRFPRWLIVVSAAVLLVANSINIGADLAGMADAAQLLTTLNSHIFVVLFGVGISLATIGWRYGRIAAVLKWLALVLFVFVLDAIYVKPPWTEVLRATLIPSLPPGSDARTMLVAVLGTTISPYLFFWQAGQEVEEERAHGRHSLVRRRGAVPARILWRAVDVGVGTFFSNIVMYFIVLTTALTLYRHGITSVATSRDIARALEPLAGRFATLLYTIGLIATGFLAIPALAGSAAYALAETFGWREGLDYDFRHAPAFYAVVTGSMLLGIAMNFANLNAIRTLYWSSVLNGLIAPFLLLGILAVASDRKVMAGLPSPPLERAVVGLTTIAMFVAAVAMFV
jgi:NRAMP (natural resistance-associated macrophage protein)-like metal ion transporter